MKNSYYYLGGLLVAAFLALVGSQVPAISDIGVRYLVGATDYLAVYVNNPSVPAPGTGGGGTSGETGGSSGGGGGGGGAAAPSTSAANPATGQCQKKKGDINCDSKVNLVDFSILAYWYKRPLTPQALQQGVDLNGDGKVTLADFSILAYYWTGNQ